MRRGSFCYFTQFIKQLSIRLIDFSDTKEKYIHNQIVKLVKQKISIYEKFNEVNTPSEPKK
jgi:hypothetical protein